MRLVTSDRLYCFSPPVMLATFLIEISFALYIVWRYKLTTLSRLVCAILMCLGIFQAAEFLLCGGFGLNGGLWSRIGYSAITLLPPLGLHLGLTIARKKHTWLLGAAYASAALFVGYYAFTLQAISGHTCYANYAVFDTSAGFIPSFFYGLYYYGWLVVGITLALGYAKAAKAKRRRAALYSLAAGYAAFMLPTTAFNLIDPSTVAGIPSIMCGFAIILAFILVGKVAPNSLTEKQTVSSLGFKLPF